MPTTASWPRPFPLGDIDAYRDGALLYSCFVSKVPFFEEFGAPDYLFLAGKRGSGKSATVLKLHHDDPPNTVLISWHDTARDHFDYFDAFLAELIQVREYTYKGIWDALRPSLFFKATWKYVIHVAVMRHLAPPGRFYLDHTDAGTVYSFLRNKGLHDKGPFQVFQGFLKQLAGFADLDPRSEQIGKILGSLEGLLNDPEYREAVEAAERLADRLENPLTLLIDAILDRVVSNDEMLIASVAALMEAVWEMQPYGEKEMVRIKCTIPGEAFERLQHFDILKFSTHTVFTRWTLERLREFIERRLRAAPEEVVGAGDTRRDVWSSLFPAEITNRKGFAESSFAYMCRHTHYFPREILLTTTRLLDFRERHAAVGPEDFARLVHSASDESAAECLARAELFYPGIRAAFAALRDAKRLLLHAEVLAILRREMGSGNHTVWLDTLVEIGILGVVREPVRSDGKLPVSFAHSAKALPLYNRRSVFAIHPMFYGKLGTDTTGDGYVWPEPFWDGLGDPPAGSPPPD